MTYKASLEEAASKIRSVNNEETELSLALDKRAKELETAISTGKKNGGEGIRKKALKEI
jgi:hypothetical protein